MTARTEFRTLASRGWWTTAVTTMALVWALAVPAPVKANTIVVRSVAETDAIFCTLPDAITAHNTADKVNHCDAGSGGDDTIELSPPPLSPDIFLDTELPAIRKGQVILSTPADLNVTIHGGYFTVNKGATLKITDKISDSTGLAGEYTINRALFNVDGTLNIFVEAGHFSDHGVSGNTKVGDLGGVIFVGPTGTVSIGGAARFTGNTARQKGGVIYNNGGEVKIDLNSAETNQVSDNDATSGQGGVIYTNGGRVTVSGIRMSNNRANDGPCIFAANRATVILSKTICENSQGSVFGHGGGLTAEDSQIQIFDSTFSNNHEGDQNNPAGSGLGGAIYIDANSDLTMIDDTCSNNSALAGGCLWSNESRATILLQSVTCAGNKAHVGGCAELNGTGVLDLRGTTISGNKALANGSGDGFGGALAVRNGTLTLGTSTVTGNTAGEGGSGGGGAIFGDPASTVKLQDTTCSGNIAFNGAGGCISAEGTMATITGLTCLDNSAFQGGCINLRDDATLTIAGSKINGNHFNQDGVGGGIRLGNNDKLTIQTTQIIGNQSVSSAQGKSSGGGIYAPSHDDITITRTTIAGNTANGLGAGLELEDFGSLLGVNDTFANEGEEDVPARGIHSTRGRMTFISSTFWKAPLYAEEGTSVGNLRNSIFYRSAYCLGKYNPVANDFDIQYPASHPGCVKENIEVADPHLDPGGLKENGGPTPTVAELPVTEGTSTSIDYVPHMFCTEADGKTYLKIDQRGEPRPAPNGNQMFCDAGAYEYQPPKP
jgi:predicted outer membrane repeat protein